MKSDIDVIRINTIRQTNIDMYSQAEYRAQEAFHAKTANYRYQILPSDFSGLYRQHYRKAYGIDVTIPAEHNVDNWLNPKSPHFKPSIHRAVFYYHARASEKERLRVSICTAEMKEAAWTYCHKGQIVLDGTFGLCTSRLLLWIALGVDKSGHGVPVAMFLFSARTGNKATHAGYDTRILTEVISEWSTWMGKRGGESFSPYVAITDTDLKARGALIAVWSDIILLLCKFHIRQCWTNRRSSVLPRGDYHWRTYIVSRMQWLEEADVIIELICASYHHSPTLT